MTTYEAKRLALPRGWVLRLDQCQGMQIYLTDYRRSRFTTTVYPAEAEYFRREIDAVEMARRATHLTGQRWVAVTVPPGETGGESYEAQRLVDLEDAAFAAAFAAVFGEDIEADSDGDAVRTAWGLVRPRWGSDAPHN